MDPYRDIAQFYDLEHADFRDDVEFYLNILPPGPVLEIGAGTGRILEKLAAAGHEVWGVDSSPAMLARAMERMAGCRNAHLIESSVGRLQLARRFPVALLPLNTLWHIPDLDAQLQALQVVRDHLTEGGTLILDCTNPLSMADRGASGEVRQRFERVVGDRHVAGFSVAWDDEAEQRLSLSLVYEETAPNGASRRTRARLTLRYVHRFELELLLRLSRFRLRQAYGWYDLRPYSADSPNLIAVAEAR